MQLVLLVDQIHMALQEHLENLLRGRAGERDGAAIGKAVGRPIALEGNAVLLEFGPALRTGEVDAGGIEEILAKRDGDGMHVQRHAENDPLSVFEFRPGRKSAGDDSAFPAGLFEKIVQREQTDVGGGGAGIGRWN